jgi:methylmalonyl-CoA mutase cobalamin-binding subunit
MPETTKAFPKVMIEDREFSRVLLGHNPFLGYSYYSEARAAYYAEKFLDPARIEEVIAAALDAGVGGMMMSLEGPRAELIVTALQRACEARGRQIPVVVILGADFADHPEMLRKVNAQVGVLHGQITDALYRKSTGDFAPEFAEHMSRMRALGLVSGASSHNAGETVPAMARYDVAVVNTPVNKIGWRMCPCPEDALSALGRTDMTVIGMKPLAMARIPPAEAMEYALSRPEVDIVLAGAASPEEVQETFGAAHRALRDAVAVG